MSAGAFGRCSGTLRWGVLAGCCGGALALACLVPAAISGTPQAESPRLGSQPGSIFNTPEEQDPVWAARRRKALNEARQKALASDSEKLLTLARELDAEVRDGGAESLTPMQTARLAQIEKLARRVKEKMIESDADVSGPRPLYSPLDK